MDRLKNYKNPDGSFNSWNILGPNDYNPANPGGFLRPLYWDNPYYDVNENTPTLKSNRVYGDMGLTVNLHKNFSVTGTVRGDNYNDNFNQKITQGGLSIPRYAYRFKMKK